MITDVMIRVNKKGRGLSQFPLINLPLPLVSTSLNQLKNRELSEVETRQPGYILCQKSPKPTNAMNRRLYKRLVIVETAIYRVFVMIYRIFSDLKFSSKKFNRTVLGVSLPLGKRREA
ncbi:hypothetical protein IQ277_30690 [Nostocales cyanobacterium LEGE 12452]|nr:hypothetical protein [Nostocales cyanobacterium LEGE 12452]